MLQRLVHKVRGVTAHKSVDRIAGQFEKHVDALTGAVDGLNTEIKSNAVEQLVLETRNEQLRTQRERAERIKGKLSELVG